MTGDELLDAYYAHHTRAMGPAPDYILKAAIALDAAKERELPLGSLWLQVEHARLGCTVTKRFTLEGEETFVVHDAVSNKRIGDEYLTCDEAIAAAEAARGETK